MIRALFEPSISPALGIYLVACVTMYQYDVPAVVKWPVGIALMVGYIVGGIRHDRRFESVTRERKKPEPTPKRAAPGNWRQG